MDALEALQTRVSQNLLEEPGPSGAQLNDMLLAALRAPDHKNLRPWQFVLVEGDARNKLGELMAAAALDKTPALEEDELDKLRRKPLRAPTIVVVAAKIEDHPKVPRIEQVVSAGAAANNIVLAAYAMGIGAMWRTGSAAFSPIVKVGLGLEEADEILGFIYLGTPRTDLKPVPETHVEDFLTTL